jgi:iron complex outermembrane receptor protein
MKTGNGNGLQLDLDLSPPTALRNGLRWAAGALVAVAAGYTAPSAIAQDSEPQLTALEEVFVTARRREESLQDVPIAVTAMDGDYLREQNITELSDLGIHVPSLRFSEGGASTNIPLITLRGQRPSEVLLTLDPAVPVYFAEVVLTPSQGTNLGMYDLANVQVLKGPQGTLFGRNSTGGALLLTPQTPGTELGGYGEVKVGDYNLYQFEGAADLPVNDQLQFRVAGRSLDRDGYQTNVADNELRGDEYWDEDSYGYRFTTNYEPTDRLSTLTTVAYDKNDMNTRVAIPQAFNSSSRLGTLTNLVHNGGAAVINPAAPSTPAVDEALARQRARDWTDVETDVGATETVENWIVSNIVEYELADALSVKNILGYRNLDSEQNADVDGTAVPLFGAATSLTESVTPNPPQGVTTASQYSEELQLLGNSFDDRLDWIVGVYWMQMQGSESYTSQVQGANPDWPAGGIGVPQIDAIAQNGYLQLSPNANTDNEAWAIYSEGTYTINDQWSVTAGARQTWDERKMEAMNFSTNTTTLQYGCAMFDENNQPLPDDNCSRKVSESFDELTGRGSLNFTPTQEMLIYASAASGYRTGGFNARGVNDFTLQPFDPETVMTYELGQKTDWDLFDLAMMRTNLAVYYQDYDDIQKTISGTNPASGNFESYTVNAAKAEISGVEFEVTVAPTDNLNLSVAYAYVDAKYKQWDRETNPGVISDFSGVPFVYVPENSFTGSVAYTLPLDASYGDVMLVGSMYWQDKMVTNDGAFLWPTLGWSEDNLQEALATVEADDYTVANFRVDWRSAMGSQFDAAAFVNNAFDEDYVTGGLSVPDSLGWVGSTYGPPRTYGVALRYNF